MTGEFDPLDVKKASESQKCAQSVLSSNERHIVVPGKLSTPKLFLECYCVKGIEANEVREK